MKNFNFTMWITVVGPLAAIMFGQFVFLHSKTERMEEQITANNERWLDTQGKIYALMSRMDMRYDDPTAVRRQNQKKDDPASHQT